MAKVKKKTLFIQSMHCPSCEVLIKDKFLKEKNITQVRPNFRNKTVEVFYTGKLDEKGLNKAIQPFGYQIVEKLEEKKEHFVQRLVYVMFFLVVFLAIYSLSREWKLFPDFNPGSKLSFVGIFILGIVASVSTCMATSGALLLTITKNLNKSEIRISKSETNSNFLNSNSQNVSSFYSGVLFNLGRILSYGFFGFLVGSLGKTIASNFQLGQILTLIVSILMILIGLNMANLISFNFTQNFTGGIFERLEQKLIKNPRSSTFFLGAITYFLPCGFTQTAQLYALGLADPLKSALTMMIFALGTTPALLTIGLTSSFSKSKYYPFFMKTMGVLVFMVGISYFFNFLTLKGVSFNLNSSQSEKIETNVILKNGVQEAVMHVNSSGYSPDVFTVKKGIPVKWIIKGDNVFGCQNYIVMNQFNIRASLKPGDNIFEFTSNEVGTIPFSCSMGMYRGRFEVVD